MFPKISTGIHSQSGAAAAQGLHKYTRIDDKHCQPAIDWWEQYRDYWKLVRAEWNNIFDRNQNLHFVKTVDDRLLWEALFDLGDELAEQAEIESSYVSAEIENVIQLYISDRDIGIDASY